MKTLLLVIIVILWASGPILWFRVMWTHNAFYNHLRDHHREAWVAAGSPAVRPGKGDGASNDDSGSTTILAANSPMAPILLKRGYRAIADAKLQVLGDRAWQATVIGLPLSFLDIVLCLALAGIHSKMG